MLTQKSASRKGSAFLVWRVENRTEGNGGAEMSTEPCSSVLKNKSPILKSQAFERGTDLVSVGLFRGDYVRGFGTGKFD